LSQRKVRVLSCPCCAGPIEQEVTTGQSIQCAFCNSDLRIGPKKVDRRSEPVLLPGLKSLEIQAAAIGQLFALLEMGRKEDAAELYGDLFGEERVASERAVFELLAGRMVSRLGLTLTMPQSRATIRQRPSPRALHTIVATLCISLGLVAGSLVLTTYHWRGHGPGGSPGSIPGTLLIVLLVSLILYSTLRSKLIPSLIRLRGFATVLSSRLVGTGSGTLRVLQMEVEVAPERGDRFKTRVRKKISTYDNTDYSVGTRHRVLYDNKDHSDLIFCWSLPPEAEPVAGSFPRLEPGEEICCPKCGSTMWGPDTPVESLICEFCGAASAAEHVPDGRASYRSILLPGFHFETTQTAAIAELKDLVTEHRREEAKRLYASIFSTDEPHASRGVDFLASGRAVREYGMNILPWHLLTMCDFLLGERTSTTVRLRLATGLAVLAALVVLALGTILMPGPEELRLWILGMGPVIVLGLLGWLAESKTIPVRDPIGSRWVEAPAKVMSWDVKDTPHSFSILKLGLKVKPSGRHPFRATVREWALKRCAMRVRPGLWVRVMFDPLDPTRISIADR
jgi:hypothetical protein